MVSQGYSKVYHFVTCCTHSKTNFDNRKAVPDSVRFQNMSRLNFFYTFKSGLERDRAASVLWSKKIGDMHIFIAAASITVYLKNIL